MLGLGFVMIVVTFFFFKLEVVGTGGVGLALRRLVCDAAKGLVVYVNEQLRMLMYIIYFKCDLSLCVCVCECM